MATKKVEYIDSDSNAQVTENKNYQHYVKAAPELSNFEEVYKLEHHLVHSYEELMDFYKNKFVPDSFFAWDTETTSLNPEQGEKTGDFIEGIIVGYSFTQDGHNGYYVPIKHPDIAIGYKGLKVLYAMICRSKLNLLYNARFDMRFLEFMTPEKYGYTPDPDEKIYPFDLSNIKYLDVQCATWLADTNIPMPSLKKSEKHFLGWIPPTFAETTGGEGNFGYLPAVQGYRYACIEENTLIKTTNGNKKIKDITVNDTVYSSSGINKVLATYNNGIKHTIKCTYKNDYILVCTPDHKIAVNTVLGPRLVQAKDLDTYTTLYTGGINFNDLSDLNQDYSTLSFNVSVLQNIDFMYWLLGFTMTDGNLIKNRLAYKIQKRDLHVLEDIKNYVKSQSKIIETISKSPTANKINTAVNLYICNKTCCDFMRSHGMTENKATRVSYNVPDEYFPSFLRGIYDGDGSSNGNNICFIGYPEFIEKLQSDIYRLYGLTSSLHKNKPDDKVIVMTFTKYASLQLMNIMYSCATIFIRRKMEKALRKHRLFYVSKCNNYKKRANYTEIARELVGIEEFQKLDHICKSFNINSSALSRVISGKWKQYKGLTVTTNIGKLYKTVPSTMTIEDIGDRQVFDLQIENDPSFITSNGFIVHNCIDALGTYHLFFKTERYLTESGAAGKLDNEVLYPLMKLENTPIYVDHEYLKNIRGDILKHLEDLKKQLYTAAGYEFNISAARELIGVFQSMGIDTGYRTATGTMKTDIKTLDIYMTSHGDNDFIKKLIEYKKLLKFDNSYLKTLLEISDPNEVKKHPIRFNYFTCRVPSGRLAAGTDGKNTFFSPVNFQSLPKPHSHNYHCHKATPEQIANKEDICGYIFDDNPENSLGLVEGQDPHLNVRMAIHPPTNDSVIISVDMCLEGGSPVQTKRGYIGISEVKVGDEILTPNGYTNIVRIKNTGKKPLYKIKTDGQAIYCSEDHPFMINNEQVPANKITETLTQESFKPYIKYNPFIESTPTSAYLLGYILGDGNINIRRNNYYTLNITSKDYKHIEQIANIFSDDIKISKHIKNNKYVAWSINIVDQDVCKCLVELGIKPRKSYVDSSINFEWLGDNLNHFIRGLIDSDGCIRIKNGNQLEITIAGHESYIKEIFNYMSNQWSLYEPKNEHITIINKLWSNTDKRDFYKYLYTNATIWLQRKRDIYDDYIISKYGHLPEFEMYDITIDSDDHVYLCNGIKTHNCAEELRMAANVYNEPTWIKAFNTGQDVHKATAIKIFGEENYCKEARKRAKTANFGILYGASAYGFHNSFPDMSLEECEDFIEKFKSALPSIEKAQKNAVRYAKKNGYIKTYFGRPRRVKYYLEHPTRKMRSFGERTVKNTAIQGAAGDCLKLMLVRLWKDLFIPYKDKGVRWVGTIHDEINYVVPRYLINEIAPIIMRCQTIKLPDWPVVLEPDMSIGTSFGSLIPFYVKYNDDGTLKELVPQIEEIKEKDMHPSDTINEYVPEVAEDTYDYMQ